MKKVFSSNSELAHAWANQLQDEGRASSIFFYGPVIYSYGYHYEIARFIEGLHGQKVCFVNSNGYSNTTAKHTNHVWEAIPDGVNCFKVPFPNNKISLEVLPEVVTKITAMIQDKLQKQIKARTDFRFFIDARDLFNDVNTICDLFGLPSVDFSAFPLWDQAEDKSNLLRATQGEREEQKKQKEIEKEKENLSKWLTGDFNGYFYNLPVHFRLTNGGAEIQTTKGAKVSIEAAKILYNKIKSGLNCRGEKIDGFTVLENNSDTIKIGCHVISWQIADAFFSQVN